MQLVLFLADRRHVQLTEFIGRTGRPLAVNRCQRNLDYQLIVWLDHGRGLRTDIKLEYIDLFLYRNRRFQAYLHFLAVHFEKQVVVVEILIAAETEIVVVGTGAERKLYAPVCVLLFVVICVFDDEAVVSISQEFTQNISQNGYWACRGAKVLNSHDLTLQVIFKRVLHVLNIASEFAQGVSDRLESISRNR